MKLVTTAELQSRLEERGLTWRVRVEETVHTASSIIAFGHREQQSVVLKVAKRPRDEWLSGPVVDAFEGRGVVRALELDPKGVVGELAYEAEAALRSPCEHPEVFAAPTTILRRVDCFARVLRLDERRIPRLRVKSTRAFLRARQGS